MSPEDEKKNGVAKYNPEDFLVEPMGFEPTTSSMPSRRAPNCATAPHEQLQNFTIREGEGPRAWKNSTMQAEETRVGKKKIKLWLDKVECCDFRSEAGWVKIVE